MAIVTGIVSALTNRRIRNDLAMTGEITLMGRVLRIGGLNTKVRAAFEVGASASPIGQEELPVNGTTEASRFEDFSMATFILTWNPVDYPWEERDDEARDANGGASNGSWTCGGTKRIRPGDRVFLLRQGPDQPGIVASGYTAGEPYWDDSWGAFHVKVDWEIILPATATALSREELLQSVPITAKWRQRSSGQTPHDPLCSRPRSGPGRCDGICVARTLERVWTEFLKAHGLGN